MENIKYRKENFNLVSLVSKKDIRNYEKKYEIKIELLNEIEYNNFLEEVKNEKKKLFKIIF